nr:SAM-dependent methyltransferase [Sphingomonas sp.]
MADKLKARIAADGPIGVDEFMAAANTHYYATRDPLGAVGDFVTAPEISQMFGEIVGAALAETWARAGRPGDAILAELGPGRGTLAADALRVMRKAGFAGEAHLVETSPTLRNVQASRVPSAIFHHSLDTLPDRPLLLVGNEFFDALPVQQWIDGGERRVGHDGCRFLFTASGPIEERSPARSLAAEAIGNRLAVHGGVALIIDYGFASGERGDTLQAVKNHRFAEPLEAPGEQDLTAYVDFRAMAAAASRGGAVVSRPVSQGTWLETLGIGARAIALAARNPDQTAAVAEARRRLCDEDRMGRLFKVMALRAPGWPAVAGLEP